MPAQGVLVTYEVPCGVSAVVCGVEVYVSVGSGVFVAAGSGVWVAVGCGDGLGVEEGA